MKKLRGPFNLHELKRSAVNSMPPMQVSISGEITLETNNEIAGAANMGGKVANVWMSVAASGKDDSNTLSLDADVLINDTTCMTTKPIIAHVSGEASQQKTTRITGDTGLTSAVINRAANTFGPGDVISCTLNLTRTATPTTEMRNAIVVVEFEPNIL